MALRSSLPPCKKERQFTTSFQFCPQALAVPLLSSTSCATLKVIDVLMMVMMMAMIMVMMMKVKMLMMLMKKISDDDGYLVMKVIL